jgi:glycosyltransferase involved in cell wall biosynthesis
MNLFLQVHGDLDISVHARELARAVLARAPDARIVPIVPGPEELLPAPLRACLGPPLPDRPAFAFWQPLAYQELLRDYPRRIGYFVFEYTRIPPAFVSALESLDALATPSRWAAEVLRDNGVTCPITVIRGGVDATRFRPDPARAAPEAGSAFRFLHVGKLERSTGADLLVRAYLRAFASRRPDVSLTLAVHNPERPRLQPERWLREDFGLAPGQHGIVLQPPVPDTRALYASHHCAVFPTRGEAVGLPVMEAMACGLPTIVSLSSGITEFASDAICFPLTRLFPVDVHDTHHFPVPGQFGQWQEPTVEELADTMLSVCRHHDRALRVARAGAAFMRERFGWAAPAARLVALLQGGAID